ncbi:MAG: MFS transporter [Halolamina sp.]
MSDAASTESVGDAGTTADEERLLQGRAGRLLLTASLGWLAIQAGRLVLSPMLPAVRADLGATTAQMGFALTVIWGLYAAFQYPSGRLADRLTPATPLVGGLALLSVGFLGLAAAPTYPVFLAGAVVVGAGAGLYPTAARTLVADLFVRRRGAAFGLHTGSGDVGGVAAAGLATAVLAAAVWRAAFLPVVVVLLGVGLALHAWRTEPYAVRMPSLGVVATARRLLADPTRRRQLAVYSLYSFTWQAAVGFLPTYFSVGKGFSAAVGSGAFAVLFGVGAAVKPAAGRVADRVPRDAVALGALTVAATALAGVVVADSPAVALAAVVAFAVGLMSFPPVMQAYLMDAFPNDSRGGDLGAVRATYIGVGALGPTYVGVVADAVGYRAAFLGLVGCLALAAAGLLAERR